MEDIHLEIEETVPEAPVKKAGGGLKKKPEFLLMAMRGNLLSLCEREIKDPDQEIEVKKIAKEIRKKLKSGQEFTIA